MSNNTENSTSISNISTTKYQLNLANSQQILYILYGNIHQEILNIIAVIINIPFQTPQADNSLATSTVYFFQHLFSYQVAKPNSSPTVNPLHAKNHAHTIKPFRKPRWTGSQNNRKNGPRSLYFEENREPLF